MGVNLLLVQNALILHRGIPVRYVLLFMSLDYYVGASNSPNSPKLPADDGDAAE